MRKGNKEEVTSRCCLLLVSLKLSPVITLSLISLVSLSSFSFCDGGYIKHREGLQKLSRNKQVHSLSSFARKLKVVTRHYSRLSSLSHRFLFVTEAITYQAPRRPSETVETREIRKFIHEHIHSSIAYSKDIFTRGKKRETRDNPRRWFLEMGGAGPLTTPEGSYVPAPGYIRWTGPWELPKLAIGGDHLLARRLPMPRHELAHSICGTRACLTYLTTCLHSIIAIAMLAGVVRGSVTALSHATPAAPLCSSLSTDLSPVLANRRRTAGVLGAPEEEELSRLVGAVARFADQVLRRDGVRENQGRPAYRGDGR
jgi:hypothetical protein